jgi:hypothetical protein
LGFQARYSGKNTMRFSSYKPAAFLADFVDNFWLYEEYEAGHLNERFHVPLFSKPGQFYPIQPICGKDIISLGDDHARKEYYDD